MEPARSSAQWIAVRTLLLRVALVCVATLLGAVGFAFVRLVNLSIQAWALNLATAAGLGLLAGGASRLALANHSWGLRALTGIVATIMGLVFLSWITWGFAGLSLTRPQNLQPDWFGLTEVALGGLASLLALHAWRRAARQPRQAEEAPAQASAAREPARRSRPRAPVAQASAHTETQAASASRPTRRGWPGLPAAFHPRRWFRNRGSARTHIRLRGMEESRCPYCLDIVRPRDPRGVVVCPICHTPHHADCWAVTGMCQVPHYH